MGKINRIFFVILAIFILPNNAKANWWNSCPVNLESNSNAYMLKMYSNLLGEWMDVALIYGYGLNRERCQYIAKVETSYSLRDGHPRKFSCSSVKSGGWLASCPIELPSSGGAYVLKMYSNLLSEWMDVAIIHGYGLNKERCNYIARQERDYSLNEGRSRLFECAKLP